jgi:hypothetical protein
VAYRFANLDNAKIRTEEAKKEACRLGGKFCAALDQLMKSHDLAPQRRFSSCPVVGLRRRN